LGDKRHIFLTNRVDSSISIIDMDKMEKVADITGLPSGPDCMDVTADGKELWVTFRFAKKVGIKQSVAKEFNQADKGSNYKKLPDRTNEGGDVFMANIKDTPEYKAGFATGKLPVPHPEGTQQYASYYKGVIDKASPTLNKVGEGEQQKGADYRDPPEADYGDDYQDMVARMKKLAGLGPLKTVYDPAKRVYRNMPTAVQPKK
jgi:hypothetical protein